MVVRVGLPQPKLTKSSNKERPMVYDFPSVHSHPPHFSAAPQSADHQPPAIFVALKGVGVRQDWISSLPEAPNRHLLRSSRSTGIFLEEINGELAIHLAVLYFMVEVFRGDDTWGEELSKPTPSELSGGWSPGENAKGYPVKKLLLLLWKSMLVTLGGMRDVDRVKKMVPSVESLPPNQSTPASSSKVSPLDFYTFRKEIITKYPTYVSPDVSEIYLARLAAAAALRPSAMYHPANSTIPHDPSGHIKALPTTTFNLAHLLPLLHHLLNRNSKTAVPNRSNSALRPTLFRRKRKAQQ
ncbi:hypothetical protein H4Q26_001883 [Puccinia striiformis f. sp. tritici PST-130]|nr:hypothetical protein H4Q26_001883 [Puccinia striiformis f. sp. tritici PST-130]